MKNIKFPSHAKNRMRWPKISEVEGVSAIENPQYIESSIEGRINAWIKISEKFLRVTYKKEVDKILIISAVKKKKGRR